MGNQHIIQNIAAKAVIVNGDGEVLILREASTYKDGTNVGRYHLPGGRVQPGEPFFDALHREVAEETGLTVTIGAPLYVGEWTPAIKGVPHQIVAVFMQCALQAGELRLSEEHDAHAWVKPNAIDAYDIMPPDDTVIKQVKI